MASAITAAWTIIAVSAVAAAPVAAAPAEPFIPREPTRCTLSAWPSYQADAPVAVRATPSLGAAIVGHFPVANGVGENYPYSVGFDITETRPGWLKIANGRDAYEAADDNGKPLPPRKPYTGEGWIAASMAQVNIQSGIGRARPDAKSEALIDLKGDWLTEFGTIDAIRGCAGEWLLVDYRITQERTPGGALEALPEAEQRQGTAWFRGICQVEETTCDMASVDDKP